MKHTSQPISTESYKGVRDFYPEEMFVQNYIFDTMKKVAHRYGYSEYGASLLESAELYRAKSGEEIVNDQTYTFVDRGEREVTLRPEMTPTVARMIAAKQKELVFPVRWFSIPNLFRYEKPQRGRLREHWQLNVDIFGVDNIEAEIEVISLAHALMQAFGATNNDFVIKVNSRKLINTLYDTVGLSDEERQKISKIIDKKEKIDAGLYRESILAVHPEAGEKLLDLLSSTEKLLESLGDRSEVKELLYLIENLIGAGIDNVVFEPTLMRGFDYYTGIVFEVFDTHPDNKRSLFGGGRYDDLLAIFDKDKIPAFGFGMGDVTIADFLAVHNLMPAYTNDSHIFIATINQDVLPEAKKIARTLRSMQYNVVVNLTNKKIGDQIKLADRMHIPYVITVGEEEIQTAVFPIKHLGTKEEHKIKIEDISTVVSVHP